MMYSKKELRQFGDYVAKLTPQQARDLDARTTAESSQESYK